MTLSIASVGALGNTKTSADFTVPVPTGVTSGSLVCVAVMGYAGGSAPGTPDIEGFTLAQSSAASLNAFGLQFKTWWFYKYATGADSGTYAGTCTLGNAIMAFAFRVAGWAGSSSPFADSLHEAATTGATATVASFTPAGDDSLLALIMLDGGANYPVGWAEATNAKDIDGDTITLASIVQTTAAATGSITAGNADGTVLSVATLREVANSQTYDVSGTVAMMSGTLGAVQSLLEVAGTTDAVSGVEANIASLLTVAGVTAAHSTAEGNVSGLLSVSGQVDAESSSEGDVTLDADLSVSGVVHAVSGSEGSVGGVFSVSGTVVVKSTTSGSVNGGSVPGGGGSTGAKPIGNIATEFGGVGGLFGNVDAKTVRDSTKKANGRAYPNVNPLSGNQELTSSKQTDSTDPNSGPKYGTGGKRVF